MIAATLVNGVHGLNSLFLTGTTPTPTPQQVPDDEDVVAGWTAFGMFGLLILAVALLGFSLTKRLKNVQRASEDGLYDPSDPKDESGRPLRGLALARAQREQAAAEQRAAE